MEQISSSKPPLMIGEKPNQYDEFIKYLEHRSYKKGIFNISERELQHLADSAVLNYIFVQ